MHFAESNGTILKYRFIFTNISRIWSAWCL